LSAEQIQEDESKLLSGLKIGNMRNSRMSSCLKNSIAFKNRNFLQLIQVIIISYKSRMSAKLKVVQGIDMKIIKILFILIIVTFMTSCNTSNFAEPALKDTGGTVSPFVLFEDLKKEDTGLSNNQADTILKAYGIYDRVAEKAGEDYFAEAIYDDVRIDCYNAGNKNIAILSIRKGHLFIYVMFSDKNSRWEVDGFVCQTERDKPEYRVEQSDDGERYWLVLGHESNHGTGLNIYDEIWYNPDGTIAAEYPVEGSALFLPQAIKPEAHACFSASASYDGDNSIYLSYTVNFEYDREKAFKDYGFYSFKSKFSPVIRDYWVFDLVKKTLEYVSSDPPLHEMFSSIKHEVSDEYGILQGYIDFYRMKLGNKEITTPEDWEMFMGQEPRYD